MNQLIFQTIGEIVFKYYSGLFIRTFSTIELKDITHVLSPCYESTCATSSE